MGSAFALSCSSQFLKPLFTNETTLAVFVWKSQTVRKIRTQNEGDSNMSLFLEFRSAMPISAPPLLQLIQQMLLSINKKAKSQTNTQTPQNQPKKSNKTPSKPNQPTQNPTKIPKSKNKHTERNPTTQDPIKTQPTNKRNWKKAKPTRPQEKQTNQWKTQPKNPNPPKKSLHTVAMAIGGSGRHWVNERQTDRLQTMQWRKLIPTWVTAHCSDRYIQPQCYHQTLMSIFAWNLVLSAEQGLILLEQRASLEEGSVQLHQIA